MQKSTTTADELERYHRDGYFVARALFNREEVRLLAERFEAIDRHPQRIEGFWEPRSEAEALAAGNPLLRHPRYMQPHLREPLSKRCFLNARVGQVLQAIMAQEPVGIQTMYYWKPPGSKGQDFHQDNFYARVKPAGCGCVAAWMAVDPATLETGCLQVVPGTQNLDLLCPALEGGFLDLATQMPNAQPLPVELEPGDVLFFGSTLVHGSGPNRHPTQWRRAHICHYAARHATHMASFFASAMAFDGQSVTFAENGDAGPCGGPEGTPAAGLQ